MRGRRRFDHLVMELSVATGRTLPRYPLWLFLQECGWDPESLSRADTLAFSEGPLETFLETRGLRLGRGAARRLRRALERFDPRLPTPDERLARL